MKAKPGESSGYIVNVLGEVVESFSGELAFLVMSNC